MIEYYRRMSDDYNLPVIRLSLCTSKKYYIELAIKEAIKSSLVMKHGCVIVNGHKIVATGHNNYSTKRKYSSLVRKSTHAEMDALFHVKDKSLLRNADMYVVRVNVCREEIKLKCSSPCIDCHHKLIRTMNKQGLRNVYYSVEV